VQYTVNGRDYASDFRLPPEESSASTVNHRHGLKADLLDSRHITLYYNPENPQETTLQPGNQGTGIYVTCFAGTFTAVCSLLVLVLASWLSKDGLKGRRD
jgi:hypothetical protein